jgi:hypothetical protein
LKHASKFEPAEGKLESTETLKFGSPKMGPVRAWTTFDFVWNNVDTKKALKHSLNLQVKDQYNLGYKLEHDLSKLKTLFAQVALKNDKGDFFLKSDILKQHVIVGCNHKHTKNGELKAWHSTELLYDLKGETKGIKDLPVTLYWAGEYPLNPFITVKAKLDVKKETTFHCSWIHQFDKCCRFIWSDNMNLNKLISDPAKVGYNFGVMFEYNL